VKRQRDELQRQRDEVQRQLDSHGAEIQQTRVLVQQQARRIEDLQGNIEDAHAEVEHYKWLAADTDKAFEEVRAKLNVANREIDQLKNVAAAAAAAQRTPPSPTSPTNLHPGSARGPRPSSDSGFSEGSNATSAADNTRLELAQSLFEGAVDEFGRGQYEKAYASFTSVQTYVQGLPAGLQKPFKSATLSCYRAVCRAETGTDNAAETALTGFLQDYSDRADARQKAHVTHLLARTYVKLGRLDDALTRCYEAKGLWRQIDDKCDEYFDAVALLARVFHLRQETSETLAVIRMCPDDRKDYVREKYATLRPTMAPAQASPTVPKPATKLPTRPAPTSKVSSTGSSSKGSHKPSKRTGLAAWMQT